MLLTLCVKESLLEFSFRFVVRWVSGVMCETSRKGWPGVRIEDVDVMDHGGERFSPKSIPSPLDSHQRSYSFGLNETASFQNPVVCRSWIDAQGERI